MISSQENNPVVLAPEQDLGAKHRGFSDGHRRRNIGRIMLGSLGLTAVTVGLCITIPAAITQYNNDNIPAPSGPATIEPYSGVAQIPESITASPSQSQASPTSPDATPIPNIEAVAPANPISAEFIPAHGKPLKIRIGTTKFSLTETKDGNVTVVHPTIDPPLIYCPGTQPENVIHHYTIAKTEQACEQMYIEEEYGRPYAGPASEAVQNGPTIITSHKSVLGYKLPGNYVASIAPGAKLVLVTPKGTFTYKIHETKKGVHLNPREGTNELETDINALPNTSVMVETCDAVDGVLDAVAYDLISAHPNITQPAA